MGYRSNEKALWQHIKKHMAGRWDATRHEDTTQAGVPDVSYGRNGVNGWIELKCTRDFPTRGKNKGIARVSNLRPAQKRWMRMRMEHGNYTWLLVRVGRNFHVLYPASHMHFAVEYGIPRDGEVYGAVAVWPNGIDFKEFAARLTKWG